MPEHDLATPQGRWAFVNEHVPGWISMAEGELLYTLAAEVIRCGRIVELGSWMGRSACYLGWGSAQKGGRLICVDHFQGSAEHQEQLQGGGTLDAFERNIRLAGIERRVCPLVGRTDELAGIYISDQVDLLFIDAGHDYAEVRRDYDAWRPKVRKGGWVALHDYLSWPGPTQLVDELLLTDFRACPSRRADNLIAFEVR